MTSTSDHDGMVDRYTDEETPPFALTEPISGPKHLFLSEGGPWDSRQSDSINKTKKVARTESHSQSPYSASPPALIESMMTDGSCSVQSAGSDSGDCVDSVPNRPAVPQSSTTFLMSSLQTVHSDAGDSTYLPPASSVTASSSGRSPPSAYDALPQLPSEASIGSVGFSQLMQAADDTDSSHHIHVHQQYQQQQHQHQLRLGQSGTRRRVGQSSRMMPPVPEHQGIEEIPSSSSSSSPINVMDEQFGTLISSPEPDVSAPVLTGTTRRWFSNLRPHALYASNDGLHTPLLSTTTGNSTVRHPRAVTNLLSNQYREYSPLADAKATIQSTIEDDQTFEVSMLLDDPSCTVPAVMKIIGNPDLLKLWYDPIETLIVTSTSDSDGTRRHDNDSGDTGDDEVRGRTDRATEREYEGEWVEATTTALESPPSTVGFIYGIGQVLLESLGCASYGRVTMFVERRRGHVGLTVGPFQGGVNASHTITVTKNENDGGRIRIVDRVRLTRDEQQDMSWSSLFWCGSFDTCLSRCVLPSVEGYLNQVTTSMARLRLLIENTGISGETSIMVVDAIRRT